MKRKCAFCEKSRLAFIWVIASVIIINAVFNLVYSNDALTTFQILKLPLGLCIVAFFIKLLLRRD